MLAYAEKLTTNPGELCKEDMDALLEAGWSQRDFYDITLLAALANLQNRVSNAFGVELDDITLMALNEMGKSRSSKTRLLSRRRIPNANEVFLATPAKKDNVQSSKKLLEF